MAQNQKTSPPAGGGASETEQLAAVANELRALSRQAKAKSIGMRALTDRLFDVSEQMDAIVDAREDGTC